MQEGVGQGLLAWIEESTGGQDTGMGWVTLQSIFIAKGERNRRLASTGVKGSAFIYLFSSRVRVLYVWMLRMVLRGEN